jgi:hypothetical protein
MVLTAALDISNNPPGSEVFIGLVGPVGVNLNSFSSLLETSLKRLDYFCLPVKLSRWISKHCNIDESNDYSKLKGLMEEGSRCRRISGRGDFLALAGPLYGAFNVQALFVTWDFSLAREVNRYLI